LYQGIPFHETLQPLFLEVLARDETKIFRLNP